MKFELAAHALTDVGRQRSHNEDAYEVIPEKDFYVVADGMGGHNSGQVASKIAIESLRKYVVDLASKADHEFTFPVNRNAGPPEQLVSNAIQFANERIFIESMKDSEFEGMGTTVVCAMGFDNVLIMGHVGDSRIYRYRCGQLESVTRDHSLLNHYIDQGRITSDEEIKNFKETNVILKALGLKDYVDPEINVIDRQSGDLFLLCTDGLTDQVEDWVIQSVLEGNISDLDEACRVLVQLANEAGGKDNCTVMLLKVNECDEHPITSVSSASSADSELALEEFASELDTQDVPMPQLSDDFDLDDDEVTDPNIHAMPLPTDSSPSIQIDAAYMAEVEVHNQVTSSAKTPLPDEVDTSESNEHSASPSTDKVSDKPASKSSRPRRRRTTLIDTYDPDKD